MDELAIRKFSAGFIELSELIKNDLMSAFFCVSITSDGGVTALVYAEPNEVDNLMESLNDELTNLLESPHHIVSTEKLKQFLKHKGINQRDLVEWMSSP